MKRLVFILATVIIAMNLMAEGHMKFKGVEIDGTPQEFAQKLKAKGFTYVREDAGSHILQGDFAGFKECIVVVISFANKVSKGWSDYPR